MQDSPPAPCSQQLQFCTCTCNFSRFTDLFEWTLRQWSVKVWYSWLCPGMSNCRNGSSHRRKQTGKAGLKKNDNNNFAPLLLTPALPCRNPNTKLSSVEETVLVCAGTKFHPLARKSIPSRRLCCSLAWILKVAGFYLFGVFCFLCFGFCT